MIQAARYSIYDSPRGWTWFCKGMERDGFATHALSLESAKRDYVHHAQAHLQAMSAEEKSDEMLVITKDMVREFLPFAPGEHFADCIQTRYVTLATESHFRAVSRAVLKAYFKERRRLESMALQVEAGAQDDGEDVQLPPKMAEPRQRENDNREWLAAQGDRSRKIDRTPRLHQHRFRP